MDDGILESLLRELEAEVEAEAELIDQQTRHIFSSVPRPSGSSSLATEGHPYRPIIPYRMDGKLRKAAEQEMRRPAPDMPPSKRQRQDAQEGYAELGRFDYRAAGQLAQGAQGFIVTCAYQRDKSATREAIEVLGQAAHRLSPSARPVCSIVKLPCRGVALLTWQAAQGADPDLPAPSAVVARLIEDVGSKLQHPLKQAQRITPVDGMCPAQETPIRELVSRLAQSYALLREVPQAEHAVLEPGRHKHSTGAPLKFAVAFKSRSGKQEGQQVQKGIALAISPASAGGLTLPKAAEACQSVRRNTAAEDADAAAKDCSRCAGQPAADAVVDSKERDAAKVIAPMDSSAKAGLASGESQGAGVCISREVAIAAAAEGFSRACGNAGLMAEVDLKQPQAVICLEVLLVGTSTIAAVSIVDSIACVLRPRLVLKPLQVCK